MKVELDFPDSVYSKEPDSWDKYFKGLQEMANRMAMSYFKYHSSLPIKDTAPMEDNMTFTRQRMAMYDGNISGTCDCEGEPHNMSCFISRMKKKLNTGNTENCIDAANGLILVRTWPTHPKAHFRSQTEKESPGIVYADENKQQGKSIK